MRNEDAPWRGEAGLGSGSVKVLIEKGSAELDPEINETLQVKIRGKVGNSASQVRGVN